MNIGIKEQSLRIYGENETYIDLRTDRLYWFEQRNGLLVVNDRGPARILRKFVMASVGALGRLAHNIGPEDIAGTVGFSVLIYGIHKLSDAFAFIAAGVILLTISALLVARGSSKSR
jgi:hypothetical protein